MKPRFLNLGCGKEHIKGYINIDFDSRYNPDKVIDLNNFPYPFENNSIDKIYCSHTLEHLDDFFKVLDEFYRILKNNGEIKIIVPHFSSMYAYCDLTHKRFFGYYTFNQLKREYYNYQFNNKFKIKSIKFNQFNKNYWYLNFLSFFWSKVPLIYEKFLCWIFPVGEVEVILIKK